MKGLSRRVAIVNYGLEYLVSYMVLNDIRAFDTIYYIPYSSFNDSIDQVLLRLSSNDEFLFIGYNEDIQVNFNSIYKIYNTKFLNSDGRGGILKVINNKLPDNYKFKELIKYTLDWVTGEFNYRESYHLNVLFRLVKHDIFINNFINGGINLDPYMSLIKTHISKFLSRVKMSTNNVGGVNVVVTHDVIQYLDDCLYVGRKKYGLDVLIFLESSRNRVYFRKFPNVRLDILRICKEICSGGGYEHACSGIITDKILRFISKFTK